MAILHNNRQQSINSKLTVTSDVIPSPPSGVVVTSENPQILTDNMADHNPRLVPDNVHTQN